MEMTAERKDWLAAKTLVIEQLEKDGGRLIYASESFELYDKKTSGYEIDINTTHNATGETAWCDVVVKSSVQEGKGYISLCSVDMIRDRNNFLLEKYRNAVNGLNVSVYLYEYLNTECVEEDGEKVKKYSVISKMGISPVKEAK
ncbi:MAG: hypothetical protein LUD47_07825 [Clostridia bacterium]|nr:hypothetical protein [Clostridia bacterium]